MGAESDEMRLRSSQPTNEVHAPTDEVHAVRPPTDEVRAVHPRTEAITVGQPAQRRALSPYFDTAPTPIVGYQGPPRGRRRPRREPRAPKPKRDTGYLLLRTLVVVLALAVIGGGVALGLVKAGVIDKSTGPTTPSPPTTAAPTTPLLSQGSPDPNPYTESYNVGATAFGITVTTTTGASWVSMGIVGENPQFAGIVPPYSSKSLVVLGSSQVQVGASGTTVTVTSGHRRSTLTPPSAPFTYVLNTGR